MAGASNRQHGTKLEGPHRRPGRLGVVELREATIRGGPFANVTTLACLTLSTIGGGMEAVVRQGTRLSESNDTARADFDRANVGTVTVNQPSLGVSLVTALTSVCVSWSLTPRCFSMLACDQGLLTPRR